MLSQTPSNSWLEMILREGKNREIKRVLGAMRLKVQRLIRTDYGPYSLHPIPRGSVLEVPVKKKGIGGWDAREGKGVSAAEALVNDPAELRKAFPHMFKTQVSYFKE